MILKLDECAWVNGRKLERLTLTVGTGALDGDMQAWWSVQSEKDIWTLAAFEVSGSQMVLSRLLSSQYAQ